MVGGSTSRKRSTTRRSGRSSGVAAGPSGPTPTSSGEVWRVAPEWLRGDRFDALMGYPLAEAILAFAGGSRLDMGVVRSHHEYGSTIEPIDGPGFAARLEDLLEAYEPEVVAAQLNLLGSHDTPRMRTVLGDDLTGVRIATLLQATLPGAPCIYYGDEIGISGGNDPDDRRAFPWDRSRWDGELWAFVRGLLHLRAAEPALRADVVMVVGAAGGAVAYERRAGSTRLIVAVNAGDSAVGLDLTLPEVADGTRLEPLDLTGSDGMGRAGGGTIIGGMVRLDLGARCGAILRLS